MIFTRAALPALTGDSLASLNHARTLTLFPDSAGKGTGTSVWAGHLSLCSTKGNPRMAKSLDEKVIPPAKGKRTSKADFDRNRDGLYGGLPKARDSRAAGPQASEPHPPRGNKIGARSA